MPVMVERPKSARQARLSLLIRMFAFGYDVYEREYVDVSFGRNTYAFQVSVHHPEAMHVAQTVRNINQLKNTSVRHLRERVSRDATHKLGAVQIFVPSNELDDVPLLHPLGYHRKSAFAHRHSE
jgi:hypothetical protein